MRVKNFLRSDRHKHSDPDVRREACTELDPASEADRVILLELAGGDPEASVRAAALSRLNAMSDLLLLLPTARDRVEVLARLQSLFETAELTREQQQQALASGDSDVVRLLAQLGRDAQLREQALDQIGEEAGWAEVALRSSFHENRLAAASRVEDLERIRVLHSEIRSRDKVVARLLQQRLDAAAESDAEAERLVQERDSVLDSLEQLGRNVWSPQHEAKLQALSLRWDKLEPNTRATHEGAFVEATRKVRAVIETHRREALAAIEAESAPEAASAPAPESEAQASAPESPRVEELPVPVQTLLNSPWTDLPATLESQSASEAVPQALRDHAQAVAVLLDPPFETQSARAGAVRQRLGRVRVLLELDTPARDRARWLQDLAAHASELEERKGRAEQESSDRVKATHLQIDAMNNDIRAGKWGPASSLMGRLKRKLSGMEPQERRELEERMHRAEAELDRMADWQDFAARPKLEAVCAALEALPEQGLEPEPLAREIRRLQQEWKSLGVGRASNDLWPRFKAAGDVAYEPCKAYFATKAEQREQRHAARIEICDQLEQELAAIDWETVDYKALLKRIRDAKRGWSDNRITDRKPDRELEQRFSDILKPAQEKLDAEFEANEAIKAELIEKAAAIAAEDSTQHNVNQLKRLQASWKLVGITRRKQDQALWEQFNEHCRKVHGEHRDQAREKRREELAHVYRARDIIKELKAMARRDDVADTDVQALQSEFQALPDFPERDRKGIKRDFREAVDSLSRRHEKKQRQRADAARGEVQRRLELVERLEDAVIDPAQRSDALIDDIRHAWDESEFSPPRELLQLLEARRDQALEYLENGGQYSLDENEATRRDLLIRMEIAAGIESPDEDRARRMQYQLKHLQEGMMQSTDKSEQRQQLRELEQLWLAAAPVDAARRDRLQSRFLKAMGH